MGKKAECCYWCSWWWWWWFAFAFTCFVFISSSFSLSLSVQSASFSFGLRSHSKYVHQQTEHDAIKLLFIFVFISLQHHTSFSHRQWLRRRGFVCAFVRSQSLSLLPFVFQFHSIFVVFHLFQSRTSLLFTKQYIKTPLRAWRSTLFTYAPAHPNATPKYTVHINMLCVCVRIVYNNVLYVEYCTLALRLYVYRIWCVSLKCVWENDYFHRIYALDDFTIFASEIFATSCLLNLENFHAFHI